MVKISLRARLSISHIQASALFARKAHAIEKEYTGELIPGDLADDYSYAIGAVLAAVAFLEATINEFFIGCSEPARGEISIAGDVRKRIGRMWHHDIPRTAKYSVPEKYEIAVALVGVRPFDKGSRPYQDVSMLVNLRNYLIHFEPGWAVAGSDAPENVPGAKKLAVGLRGRFAPNPMIAGGNPFLPDKCLGHGCAEWAVESSLAFADSFFALIEQKNWFDHVRERLHTKLSEDRDDT